MKRDTPRHECPETLACGAAQVNVDRVVGQTVTAPAARDLEPQQRTDAPIDIADRHFNADRPANVDRAFGLCNQFLVQRPVQVVILLAGAQ